MKDPRIFTYKGKRIPDPNPELTPKQVMEVYANEHPELTSAKVQFSRKDGKDHYEFTAAAGTKG